AQLLRLDGRRADQHGADARRAAQRPARAPAGPVRARAHHRRDGAGDRRAAERGAAERGRALRLGRRRGQGGAAPDPRRRLDRPGLGGARRPQARRQGDRRQPGAAPSQRFRRFQVSKFFIHRPIFAGVIAIIIVIAGLVSAKLLAVAQYPEIAPPTVLITTSYPGASAETLSRTVAAPIEEQLSGVEKLSFFSSTSSSTGTLQITAT